MATSGVYDTQSYSWCSYVVLLLISIYAFFQPLDVEPVFWPPWQENFQQEQPVHFCWSDQTVSFFSSWIHPCPVWVWMGDCCSKHGRSSEEAGQEDQWTRKRAYSLQGEKAMQLFDLWGPKGREAKNSFLSSVTVFSTY